MGLTEPIEVIEQGDQGVAAYHSARGQPIEKPSHRRQELLVIAERVRLTERFGDQAVQEEEGAAGHFGTTEDHKSFHQLIPPAQRQLLMRDVIAPLIGFTEKALGLTRGAIQQFRQRLGDQLVELSFRGDDIVQSCREDLTVSHGLSIRQLRRHSGEFPVK